MGIWLKIMFTLCSFSVESVAVGPAVGIPSGRDRAEGVLS